MQYIKTKKLNYKIYLLITNYWIAQTFIFVQLGKMKMLDYFMKVDSEMLNWYGMYESSNISIQMKTDILVIQSTSSHIK